MGSTDRSFLEGWLQSALYETKTAGVAETLQTVKALRTLKGQHETYCPGCRKDALFRVVEDANAIEQAEREDRNRKLAGAVVPLSSPRNQPSTSHDGGAQFWLGEFKVQMRCMRRAPHFISMYFVAGLTEPVEGASPESQLRDRRGVLRKVGQTPSLADFHLHQLDDFRNAFSDADLKEWRRAITTQAHGFNVAGCVHLRRLFENILAEARDIVDGGKHKGHPWEEFDRARTPEKVKLVAAELPPFIVEHPELYGVLSKGVHQLTEEECERELPILQQCMTLIAEERVARQRAAKMKAETIKLLAESASRVGKA